MFTDGSFGKNVIIFWVDMSSSVHIENKNKDILIFGQEPKIRLDDTPLAAKAKHRVNFTQPRKRFVSSLHYNGSNNLLFLNAAKIYQFKAKDSEIKDHTLSLGNIAKDFTINNMRKNEIKRNCKIFFLSILILLIQTIFYIHINI